MRSEHRVTAEVTPEVFAAVTRMAAERGLTVEQLAGDIVREAVRQEAELLAAIEEGRAQIARGEGLSHEQLLENIESWKRERRRAA